MMLAIDHIDGGFRPALPDRRQTTRIAAGIALSLAAHVLLLATYRQPTTTLPAAAPERLTVRLRTAPPPPAPPVAIKPGRGQKSRINERSRRKSARGTLTASSTTEQANSGRDPVELRLRVRGLSLAATSASPA